MIYRKAFKKSLVLSKIRMLESLTRDFESELDSTIQIYVRDNATAFFDILDTSLNGIDISEIKDRSVDDFFSTPHNFLVDENEIYAFRIGNYNGSVRTVSFTCPCIVFCAITMDTNGKIKSSGMYHAASMPPERAFEDNINKLIDIIRSTNTEQVILKAAGGNREEAHFDDIRDYLTQLSSKKNVRINPEYFSLGRNGFPADALKLSRVENALSRITPYAIRYYSRETQFYPQSGNLVTYFRDGNRQMIIL